MQTYLYKPQMDFLESGLKTVKFYHSPSQHFRVVQRHHNCAPGNIVLRQRPNLAALLALKHIYTHKEMSVSMELLKPGRCVTTPDNSSRSWKAGRLCPTKNGKPRVSSQKAQSHRWLHDKHCAGGAWAPRIVPGQKLSGVFTQRHAPLVEYTQLSQMLLPNLACLQNPSSSRLQR